MPLRLTGGYTAPDLTGLPPKSFATLTTSHTRQPLCTMLIGYLNKKK